MEHYRLSDLNKLLSGLSLALAKNGVVVVEVPHVDLRIHAEIRGVDTPHLLFFSKDSLTILFEKYSFEVLFIDTCGPCYPSVDDFISSRSNSPNVKNHLKKHFNSLPVLIQRLLRSFVRALNKTKNIKFTSKIKLFKTLPYQTYGGNRNSLRIVVRKK